MQGVAVVFFAICLLIQEQCHGILSHRGWVSGENRLEYPYLLLDAVQGIVLSHHVQQVGETSECHVPLLLLSGTLECKLHILQGIVLGVADTENRLAVLVNGGKVEVNVRQIVAEAIFLRQFQRLRKIRVGFLVIQIMPGKEKSHVVQSLGIQV